MSESWETIVAGMIEDSRHANSRRNTSGLLKLLANLLDKNQLPAAGRAEAARVLRAVANDTAKWILPPKKKARGPSSVAIFAAVERERPHHESMQAVHAAVGRKLGQKQSLKPDYIAKMASKGRTFVRTKIRENIAAGAPREQLVSELAEILGLTTDTIEKLGFD